jgi:LPS-assembly lipoprotein
MKRRLILALLAQTGLAGLTLTGCGFKLRGNQSYAFQSLAVLPNPGGALAIELRRSIGSSVHVMAADEPQALAQVVLELLSEQHEKIVVGVNSSGQVREFQLRIRVKFRIRTPHGDDLVAASEILQQRDMSFNESAVLAKEAEEAMLYRNMQTDIVQQLLRRLATIK